MNWRTKMRMRHAVTVVALLVMTVLVITTSNAKEISPFPIGIIIFGFSLYFERCRNCRWPIWIRSGVRGLIFLRMVGPFYLPSKCAHCGSPDFESPPVEQPDLD